MYDNALFMIHNPLMVVAGNAADLREQADWLDRVGGIMQAIYMARCTKTEAELQAALEAETYLSADEALDWGFATDVVVAQQAAAASRRPATSCEALGLHPRPRTAAAATLSAANEAQLRDASTLIDEVLSTLDGKAAGDPPSPVWVTRATPWINKAMASLLTAARSDTEEVRSE